MKKKKIFSRLITAAIVIIFLFVYSCENDNNITGSKNIAEGFRAAVYKNGKLETDQFATGWAEIASPLTDAYIDIRGDADYYGIHISFSSKNSNGINGYKPGSLDSKNYSEPYFTLFYLGESVLSGYIESSSNELWQYGTNDSRNIIGTASGEIIEINENKIVGNLKVKSEQTGFEVKNCEFNLKLESSDYISISK